MNTMWLLSFVGAVFLATEFVLCNKCDPNNFPVQANFNVTKFLGTWYEMKWLPDKYIPPKYWYKDYKHTYTQDSKGCNIVTQTAGRNPSSNKCFYFDRLLLTTDIPGKYYKTQASGIASPYSIIATDYENYAVTYGCRSRNKSDGLCLDDDAWVWSRTYTLSESFMKLADAKLESLCLNATAFNPTTHTSECNADEDDNDNQA